jgi:MoaA/NifB/PqqE/SkfB family radical SAM enzyme
MATLGGKWKLARGLLGGGRALTGPFFATIDVTQRCNLNCVGCRFHSPVTRRPAPGDPSILDVSVELVERLCGELGSMGTANLIFSGAGEPMLHPRIFDLIGVAKAAGFKVSLLTNGTLLDRPRIESLIDARLDLVKVSLWGTSPEIIDLNNPGATSVFEKVVEGLRLFSRLKTERKTRIPQVALHHPINRNNFRQVEELALLAQRTGCNGFTFAPFYTNRSKVSSLSLSRDEESQARNMLAGLKRRFRDGSLSHNIDELLCRYETGPNVWDRLPCYIGWISSRIKADGSILPCAPCNLVLGSLKETTFHQIWNNAAYRDFRRKTMTRAGLMSMSDACDCSYCCNLVNNLKVEKYFRFLAPLIRPGQSRGD